MLIIEVMALVTLWSAPDLCKMNQECNNQRIQVMYIKLWQQTGESEKFIPLRIMNDDDEVNAMTDKDHIELYQGMINDVKNDDELALILGHEIGHCILGHIWNEKKPSLQLVRYYEAEADKMGAVYSLKGGWSVCKGREVYKRWQSEEGDSLTAIHPSYGYRYEQLDYGCEVKK